jgi:hypothetical protein
LGGPQRFRAKSLAILERSSAVVLFHRMLEPESGVKIAFLDLHRFQSVNLVQDVIGQVL